MTNRRAKIWRLIALVAALILLGAAGPTVYVAAASFGRITTVTEVPAKSVALVFGAGLTATGEPTDYLSARLDLAAQLYASGKVRAVLVSGDNHHRNHNEPGAMRDYLIGRGVPAAKVVADYAGFDTYSSCMRANRIFGVTEAILVTQSYHLPRAVTTCRIVGIDAWGVGDSSMNNNGGEWQQNSLREWSANFKLASDLASSRQPVLGAVETSLTEAIDS